MIAGVRVGLPKFRRQETPQRQIEDRLGASVANRLHAGRPGARVHRCGGADRDEGFDPVRVIERQSHSHHAAQRDTSDRRPRYTRIIEHRDDIIDQHVDAIVASGRLRAAMATCIHPQHMEVGQIGHDAIPEVQIGSDRIEEEKRLTFSIAGFLPMEPYAGSHACHHEFRPSARSGSWE